MPRVRKANLFVGRGFAPGRSESGFSPEPRAVPRIRRGTLLEFVFLRQLCDAIGGAEGQRLDGFGWLPASAGDEARAIA